MQAAAQKGEIAVQNVRTMAQRVYPQLHHLVRKGEVGEADRSKQGDVFSTPATFEVLGLHALRFAGSFGFS
jgi:hypothetical protein